VLALFGLCVGSARAEETPTPVAAGASAQGDASAGLSPPSGTPASSELARARALFQRGVELANHQDYTGAAKRFREALAIHHAPAVAYNLASALSETGEHAEAYELVQKVLHDGTTPEPLRVRAQNLEESLQRFVARLTVIVSSEQADVTVYVDGVRLAPVLVGETRAVAPGDHVVRAERAGVVISERSVRIANGSAAVVDVSLVMTPRAAAEAAGQVAPGPAVLPTLTAPSESRHDDGATHDHKRRRRFWIIGAASVVAVGAGVTLALLLAKPDARTQAPVAGDAMPGVLVWK
jgi:hypothetical protein